MNIDHLEVPLAISTGSFTKKRGGEKRHASAAQCACERGEPYVGSFEGMEPLALEREASL